ncbi:MAG: hypothetical protein ACFCUU_10070, partial [Cyclobacteriaceae bacterium]
KSRRHFLCVSKIPDKETIPVNELCAVAPLRDNNCKKKKPDKVAIGFFSYKVNAEIYILQG